jgi:hypothetical protein
MKLQYILGAAFLSRTLTRQSRHKPVISEEKNLTKENPYVINEPEVSLALYGSLKGDDHYYKIESDKDFNLYMGILTPKLDGETEPKNKVYFKFYDQDFNEITFDNYPTGIVKDHKWYEWFESFGKKDYWVGPEVGTDLNKPIGIYPKGEYYIKVFNENKEGNYSLAVGYIEQFSFFDIFRLNRISQQLDKFW